MSSSLLLQHVWFMIGGKWPTAAALWGAGTRTCSILLTAFLCSCHQAFFPYVKFTSMYYQHNCCLEGKNGIKLTKERSRRYPAQTITDANYTDDIVLLANAPTQVETLLHNLE